MLVVVVVVALLVMVVVVTLQGPMVVVVSVEGPEMVVTVLKEGVGALRMLRPVAKYSINASEAVCISSAPRRWSQMATTLSAQSEDSGLPCIGGFIAKRPRAAPTRGGTHRGTIVQNVVWSWKAIATTYYSPIRMIISLIRVARLQIIVPTPTHTAMRILLAEEELNMASPHSHPHDIYDVRGTSCQQWPGGCDYWPPQCSG